MAAVAAATGAANGAATGATGADAGFTITYYGALTPGVATGQETTSCFFCTAKVFSDFCYNNFS